MPRTRGLCRLLPKKAKHAIRLTLEALAITACVLVSLDPPVVAAIDALLEDDGAPCPIPLARGTAPLSLKTDADEPIRLRAGAYRLYRATVRIEDVPVEMLIDTGASYTILSERDAARVFGDASGNYAGQVQTMNGLLPLYLQTARSVVIEGRTLTDMDAGLVPGVPMSVVGMNWLGALGPVLFEPQVTARQ